MASVLGVLVVLGVLGMLRRKLLLEVGLVLVVLRLRLRPCSLLPALKGLVLSRNRPF